MSKWYKQKVDEDGILRIYRGLDDKKDCTHKCNGICCYEESEYVGNYPPEEFCKECEYFLREEQIEKLIREEIK